MQVPADMRLVHHTADTFKGESGGADLPDVGRRPCISSVIHSGRRYAQRNKGFRVTRRMLDDLVDWINADAGSTIVEVQERHARVRGDHGEPHVASGQGGRGLLEFESADGEWEGEVVREELFDPSLRSRPMSRRPWQSQTFPSRWRARSPSVGMTRTSSRTSCSLRAQGAHARPSRFGGAELPEARRRVDEHPRDPGSSRDPEGDREQGSSSYRATTYPNATISSSACRVQNSRTSSNGRPRKST